MQRNSSQMVTCKMLIGFIPRSSHVNVRHFIQYEQQDSCHQWTARGCECGMEVYS